MDRVADETCPHFVIDRVVDEKEGTIICRACSRVLHTSISLEAPVDGVNYANVEDLAGLYNSLHDGLGSAETDIELVGLDFEEAPRTRLASARQKRSRSEIGEKLKQFARISDWNAAKQQASLREWVAKGNIPGYVIVLTNRYFKNTLQAMVSRKLSVKGKHTMNCFTAFALYRVLIQEKIPRSLENVHQLTGVTASKLFYLEKAFCSTVNDLTGIRASDWLPGVINSLDITRVESFELCNKADVIQAQYSYTPATVMAAVLYGFLRMRCLTWFMTTKANEDFRYPPHRREYQPCKSPIHTGTANGHFGYKIHATYRPCLDCVFRNNLQPLNRHSFENKRCLVFKFWPERNDYRITVERRSKFNIAYENSDALHLWAEELAPLLGLTKLTMRRAYSTFVRDGQFNAKCSTDAFNALFDRANDDSASRLDYDMLSFRPRNGPKSVWI